MVHDGKSFYDVGDSNPGGLGGILAKTGGGAFWEEFFEVVGRRVGVLVLSGGITADYSNN